MPASNAIFAEIKQADGRTETERETQTDTATTEMSLNVVQFIQVTHTPTKLLT
jgi:hypothetical protein